ncbi:glycosyltransferase, partial [Candidatus Peregrinibacteria bacterium]|nr:glycosyltransferase [Candidatus Peregrinibacteria bacterium]
MLPFQKTTVYRKALETLQQVLHEYTRQNDPHLAGRLQEEAFDVTTNLAKAFSKLKKDEQMQLKSSIEGVVSMIALLDLSQQSKNNISSVKRELLVDKLRCLQSDIENFKKTQKKILILSAKMGHGHMSASSAIEEAIQERYGYDYDVEIIDFVELLSSTMNAFSKRYYESSVKFAPNMYKLLYESSNKNVQIIKLLNQINYPFVLSKIKKFFEEKQPALLISTFPIWNYLAADIWKKYNKDAKFISVVTDSITIHNSWVLADTDHYIVANEDTKQSLIDLGEQEEKIKTLGFPVKLDFMENIDQKAFLKRLKLNPKKKTILFLPTSQGTRKNQKIVKNIMEFDPHVNLIIITGRDSKNKPKLEKITSGRENVRIIGWTNKMSDFIKAADIVVTKAGGATIMECIAAAKPMIITSVIPGQEEGNAQLIKKYHLGIVCGSRDNISEHIDYINKNRSTFDRYLTKQSNPKAALDIAEFIHELLEAEV